jgi:lipopolysaccharide transport system ATP-binding protein
VLFVSHNMSAILRLTDETIVLDRGQLIYQAETTNAVDYYMSAGFLRSGEKIWTPEIARESAYPFAPVALRVLDSRGNVVEVVRSTEDITFEVEYRLKAPIQGLRIGVYLMSMRGEYVFTSFDTDDAQKFEQHRTRESGHYISRCTVPADFLNEGRYALGMNASSYRVKRYFQDEHALTFTVDAIGAPGKQWPEPRMGLVRPRLDWEIQQI